MKKSKLLIPAVAFLVVSIAAAATSTVAWFTANTQVSSKMTKLIAASSDASLFIDSAYDANAGFGATAKTFVADTAYNTLTAQTPDLAAETLRDGSVNVANGSAYYRNKNANGTLANTYSATTAAKDAGSRYYYYLNVQLKFVVKAASATQKFDIYLDSSSALTVPATYTNKHIDSALRIGMVTGDKQNVWAPNYDTTHDINNTTIGTKNGTALRYVSAATDTYDLANFPTYTYTAAAGTSVGYSTCTNIATYDATPSYKTTSNYIGRINTLDPNLYGTLTTTFYVWFEGEDIFCTNANGTDQIQTPSADKFSLQMKFNSLKNA